MDFTNYAGRPPNPALGRVVVWGATGLMGASLGLALRERTDAWVVGLGRDIDRLTHCRAKGMAHEVTVDAARALENASVLVMATPMDILMQEGPHLIHHAPQDCLVMDVGSVKGPVVTAMEAAGKFLFVGAHPMAGSEKTGMEAADIDLYEKAVVALTPTANTNPDALSRARSFWETLGSKVIETTPADHDHAVALISHLPHLAASLLVLAGLEDDGLAQRLAATGFKDTTRIASGSPALWRFIVSENRPFILSAIHRFQEKLAALENTLQSGDDDVLEALLQQAKTLRDALPPGPSHGGGEN